MSPFLEEKYPLVDSFTSDLEQLAKGLHAKELRLLGGEPLLNDEINLFIKRAKQTQIADQVIVITNGLLLHKMNDEFWENVDGVTITLYPDIFLDERRLETFRDRARQSGTGFICFTNPMFRTTILTKPQPKDRITDKIFMSCKNVHEDHCHMIHEGKFYKCAVPPFLPEYLEKIGLKDYDPDCDAFDIHRSEDIFVDLKRFLLSLETMNACCYCLGFLGKMEKHHQLKSIDIRHPEKRDINRENYLDDDKLNSV